MEPTAYSRSPLNVYATTYATIANFEDGGGENRDARTIASFGEEWKRFAHFEDAEIQKIGAEYFDIVTPAQLNTQCRVLDAGCGTGRWSRYVATQAGYVEAVDPSEAVFSAAALLRDQPNVRVTRAGIDNLPFADGSFDFILCLGVLHHIPDTPAALQRLATKLRPGGTLLLYLYYALDNRSLAYRLLFQLSNMIRVVVSSLPQKIKAAVCDILAAVAYMPFVGLGRLLRALGMPAYKKLPLSYYVDKSWHVIRNDALDRFGTPLEQRFSRKQITDMMHKAGLTDLHFSEQMPCWHVTGTKV